MPNYTLEPGQSKTLTDTEGGSDLVIKNHGKDEGSYIFANNDDQPVPHNIAPGGSDLYEVADRQSATVKNTGEGPLTINFADE